MRTKQNTMPPPPQAGEQYPDVVSNNVRVFNRLHFEQSDQLLVTYNVAVKLDEDTTIHLHAGQAVRVYKNGQLVCPVTISAICLPVAAVKPKGGDEVPGCIWTLDQKRPVVFDQPGVREMLAAPRTPGKFLGAPGGLTSANLSPYYPGTLGDNRVEVPMQGRDVISHFGARPLRKGRFPARLCRMRESPTGGQAATGIAAGVYYGDPVGGTQVVVEETLNLPLGFATADELLRRPLAEEEWEALTKAMPDGDVWLRLGRPSPGDIGDTGRHAKGDSPLFLMPWPELYKTTADEVEPSEVEALTDTGFDPLWEIISR